FEGGENLAQYVAFAASVHYTTSSPTAIEAVGRALGEFTARDTTVRAVSVPLLGAGAGGLQSEKVIAALRAGFIPTADAGATMNIYVLHQEIYDRLRGNRQRTLGKLRAPVRVFISHTSTSEE